VEERTYPFSQTVWVADQPFTVRCRILPRKRPVDITHIDHPDYPLRPGHPAKVLDMRVYLHGSDDELTELAEYTKRKLAEAILAEWKVEREMEVANEQFLATPREEGA
jgi:hypothetical protein